MAPDPFDSLRRAATDEAAPPRVPSVDELDRLVRRQRIRAGSAVLIGATALALFVATLLPAPVAVDPTIARDAAVSASLGEVVLGFDALIAEPDDTLPNAELVAMLDPFATTEDPVHDPLDGLWPEGDL